MSVSSPPKAEKERTHPTPADNPIDTGDTWVLAASSSWLSGSRYAVLSQAGNDIVKIGRGDHCDINLPGTHLAREHAELRVEPNHLYVKDKGSVTGTYINDVRVTEGVVRPGDKLRLDIYSFVVEAPESARQQAASEATAIGVEDGQPLIGSACADDLGPVDDDPLEQRIKPWLDSISPLDDLEEPVLEQKSGLTALYFFAGGLLLAVGVLAAYLLLS